MPRSVTTVSSQPGGGPVFFQVSDAWKAAYSGSHAGVLVIRGAANPPHNADLEQRRSMLEGELRSRYAGQDRATLRQLPVLKAYEAHYRRFNKTYHVQLQLESIVSKGKSIPAVAGLVEAMFMAEINNLLLTAGHDLDLVRIPLTLDVARGTESYILLRGTPQTPKAGDMMIRDVEGIVSSIVYGPDRRTQISPQTTNAIFTVYAPAGIAPNAVLDHLQEIQENVRRLAPGAKADLLQVYDAA